MSRPWWVYVLAGIPWLAACIIASVVGSAGWGVFLLLVGSIAVWDDAT